MAEVTVLYDQGCGFCTRVALRVARPGRVDITPIGSPLGSLLLRDLDEAERYASMHVVDGVGRRRSAGAALAPLARALPGGRPLAGALDAFPGVAGAAYEVVARHRSLASKLLQAYDAVAPSTSATRSARRA
jgi:predicted DCC family thiol-disulfide oxidoreductase YuxK